MSFSILVSSGYMPRTGIAGSYGGFIPVFFKESPYCLYPGPLCDNLVNWALHLHSFKLIHVKNGNHKVLVMLFLPALLR